MAVKKGGLGRGLEALINDVPVIEPEEKKAPKKKETSEKVDKKDIIQYIKIHDIMPNVNQPRKTFDEEKILELSDSIKAHGIIQPIVVRVHDKGYEIVAGERRWRAAIKAGLTKVPCLVKELDDEENMLMAIIENMQRENLNPIEEAEGVQQMAERFGMTQEEISKSVGKSRPYITNIVRLLKLPDYIKESVQKGELSQGHARALITIEDEGLKKKLWEKAVSEGISVREMEALAKKAPGKKRGRPQKKEKAPDAKRVEAELKEILGTKVEIKGDNKKGALSIEYYSREELERIIELLKTLK